MSAEFKFETIEEYNDVLSFLRKNLSDDWIVYEEAPIIARLTTEFGESPYQVEISWLGRNYGWNSRLVNRVNVSSESVKHLGEFVSFDSAVKAVEKKTKNWIARRRAEANTVTDFSH